MLQIKIFPVNPLGANCYVCWEDAGHACIVVDPGFYRADEEDMVFNFLTENGLQPDAVFLTHAHFDHAWSAASVARRCNCPVWMSAADDPILRDHSAMLDIIQQEVDSYKKGGKHEGMFPERWLPTAVGICDEEFTIANKMMNSTMKIVRGKVEEHYASLLDYLYTPEGKDIKNQRNLEALK